MKATLEFNLPEDRVEHTLAINSPKYWSVLWDFSQWLRGQLKHGNSVLDVKTLEAVSEEFYCTIDEHGVSLDKVD